MQTKIKRNLFGQLALFGGIIAVLFEWLAIGIFYINSPSDFGGEHPISYFATLPQTRFVFALCLSLAAISFWIFVKWHLSKRLVTPLNIFTFSMFCYFFMALIPFNPTETLSNATHTLLAYLFGGSFILGMFVMGKKNPHKKFKTFSLLIAVVASIISLVIFLFPTNSFFFILEAGVGFVCQIWSIGITYFLYKTKGKT